MRSLSPIRLIALLAAALSGCDLRFQEGSLGSMPEDFRDSSQEEIDTGTFITENLCVEEVISSEAIEQMLELTSTTAAEDISSPKTSAGKPN